MGAETTCVGEGLAAQMQEHGQLIAISSDPFRLRRAAESYSARSLTLSREVITWDLGVNKVSYFYRCFTVLGATLMDTHT